MYDPDTLSSLAEVARSTMDEGARNIANLQSEKSQKLHLYFNTVNHQ